MDIIIYLGPLFVGTYLLWYGVKGFIRKEIIIRGEKKIGKDARKVSILVMLGGTFFLALILLLIMD